MTRREFLRLTTGVIVVFALGVEAEGQGQGAASAVSDDLDAWLHIAPDSRVTVFTPTPEVGQGVRTSLAQMVAEELSVPVSSLDMIMGDTDRVPADLAPGSTIATIGLRLRAAAAQARAILVELATEVWRVDPHAVRIRDGQAFLADDPTTATPIGELTRGRRLVRALKEPPSPKPAESYRLVGNSIPSVDGPSVVTGSARFVADVRLPRMVYAKLLHPPCLGAQLINANARAAAEQPGVIAVVEQRDFIAVVAIRPDLAEKALRHVRATWEESEHPDFASLYEDLRTTAKLAQSVTEEGDVETALAHAQYGFSACYRTAFVAHAPIEPHGAAAAQDGDRVTIYVGTQRPFAHRDAVARALRLSPDRVRVITTSVGGAFGGKDEADLSIAAARLARATGRPVMVTHTREEELAWNYFRPAALIDVQCGVSEAGNITAWVSDAFNCGSRGAASPYAFPNQRVNSYDCDSPLRQGHWRGNGGSANTLAREVHLDHVASELGQDPVEFRLRHLAPDSRLASVVRAAAESYRWQRRPAPTGLGIGFACATDSGTSVAQIAEVEVARFTGEVRVRRVLTAYETGLIINPDGLRNQIEGAVIMGLGFALREAVRYEQGRILTDTFASYPIPTIRDAPALDTVLIPNPEQPPRAGGTPAIFPIAAAIANAIFDATGERIRELPLSPGRVRAALRSQA
ncbi:MAG: molybdopterin-dependent oxidoreductase [Armatimonadota bacterium]|nr:MAG: molybdopterin-dependent oxidoreductase [Armatimonadota bacterium]